VVTAAAGRGAGLLLKTGP